MLVGATFICLCIILSASAAGMPSNLPDLQGKLKEIKSDSFKHYRELGGVAHTLFLAFKRKD